MDFNFFLNYGYIFFNNIGEYIKNSKDLIYTFSILLATIYIPLTIELLNRLKSNKLDIFMFMKDKFNIKYIIFLYTILFILLFLWTNDSSKEFYYINLLILIASLIPIFLLITSLIKLNNFFLIDSQNFNNERLNFIKNKLNILNNNIEIWDDIFKLDLFNNIYLSKKGINIFLDKIFDEIIIINNNKYKDLEYIRTLLIKYNSLDYDSIKFAFFDILDGNLIKLLELEKRIYDFNKNGANLWIENEINNIISKKLEVLKDRDGISVIHFYKILNNHINKYKSYEKYILNFINNLLNIYFSDGSTILNNRNIVKKFPYIIKIAKLTDKEKGLDKKILLLVINRTFDYIIDNIQHNYTKEKVEINYKLDSILNYWFIDFDPITFSRILKILFIPYGDNRGKSIIEGKIMFGHIGRAKTFSYDINDKALKSIRDNEYNSTITNFKKLFPGLINKEDLSLLLNEFNVIINGQGEEEVILKAKLYKSILTDLLK